ncbi:hypothetical protein CYLTODRAFT_423187 [Cylindrobasidium torrendii FP15055 ss-10]|uniref:Uncharacterized protein n=1 Tax=Cylindrobasidium torrendii FP15055 ss-10 TaxID=1314674 RepID=A0A0D7B8B0_9AGAR|nr:hypothetical protein CYLTODRAFT_423187 [Cylindrobasidium torrendii FP15055 ss-10]
MMDNSSAKRPSLLAFVVGVVYTRFAIPSLVPFGQCRAHPFAMVGRSVSRFGNRPARVHVFVGFVATFSGFVEIYQRRCAWKNVLLTGYCAVHFLGGSGCIPVKTNQQSADNSV